MNAVALSTEGETFLRIFPELVANEGRYALIFKESLSGIFDSYQDALTAGYEKFGLEPFLVKKISTVEAVSFFTRVIV